MTLELNKVTRQIEELGGILASNAQRRSRALPALRELRRLFSSDLERLQALASSPVGRQANCALPTHEPLDAAIPAPEPPCPATIMAADGSQVAPNPHGWAPYYVINVGSMIYRHGTGQMPEAAAEPKVAYAVDEAGGLISSEQVDARRDVAEIQKLADLAESQSGNGFALALLDSTLGLRAWGGSIPQAEQAMLQQRYTTQQQRIRSAGAALAGVISRSRRSGVVNLLDLAQMEESKASRRGQSPFSGITDQTLWGDLRPGERSALLSEGGTSPVFFFYLNTQPSDGPVLPHSEAEPARIELPEWAALNPGKLGWVHALIYDQCRINNGYPYVLSRADELAIIRTEEREALEMMLLQAMSRQGMPLPRLSYKEAQKRITRSLSRRRM
jgi:hypothetical protein